MRVLRPLLLLFTGLLLAGTAEAQITLYVDSSSFDDNFARLREIDFEDVYSATVQRITFRNPQGLNVMSIGEFDPNDPADSAAIEAAPRMLWLSQGATMDFPTRTRRVDMYGGSHPFEVRVTDFNDSVYTLPLDSFPRTVTSDAGIRRLQFLGSDGDGSGSINWSAALLGVDTFDENGDTLASTRFWELKPNHAYILNRPVSAHFFFPDDTSFYSPVNVHGIYVTEPEIGFAGTFMSEWEARIDPDSPIGNLTIEMTPGASVAFPEGTEGAMIMLERFHIADSAWFEVRDYNGNADTIMVDGIGRPFDSAAVDDQRYTFVDFGVGSSAGIEKITFLGSMGMSGPMALGSVWVAEVPVVEIARIEEVVTDLDTAGFLSTQDEGRLRTSLDAAIAAVQANDRGRAVSLLNGFRNDVMEMESRRILAPEEAKFFASDASYVISRLGVTSSVTAEEIAAAAGVTMSEPVVTADQVRIGFEAPAGEAAVVRIYGLDGSIVRTLESDASRNIVWDVRGEDGSRVSAGVYAINLRAAGASVTRLVRIVR